jgi:MbtH protein
MSNPFDDEDGSYYSLVNADGQYSAWPTFAAIPEGWVVVYGPSNRAACLDFIEDKWADMRPISLKGRDERSNSF